MSTVQEPTVSPDAIFQLASGFMAAKMFFTAGNIGLFEALGDGALSADELSARTSVPVRTLRVVADANVALGMLTKRGDQYGNSPVAQTFLAGRSPADMRPMLTFWDRMSYPSWERLADAVRQDGTNTAIFDFSPEQQAIFSSGVEAASVGGAMALASTYDFSRHHKLLDVGGGTGSFLRAIGRRHAHLHLALFELPKTAAYARSRLSPEDRVDIVEGDMLKEPLPVGHDAMILAHIVHGFRERENQQLLERLYAAAPAGGRLLIVDFFLDDSRTEPVMATLMSGEFLVNTGARSYSMAEIRQQAAESGWRFVAHQALAGPVSVLVLERP